MQTATQPLSDDKPKLRVGILLNRMEVQAWVYRMLTRIEDSGCASIELVVINSAPPLTGNKTIASKIRNNAGRLGYLAVRRALDWAADRVVDPAPLVDRADARVDASPLLTGVPTLTVTPRQTKFSDYFPDEAIDQIRAANLDVIVRIGFRILRGEILHVPRNGVWSFHHGDNRVNRGGPAGFWEVMQSWPVTGSVLQVLTEDMDNGLILERSWTRTNLSSMTDSRSKMLWKSLEFVPRNLRRLHAMGSDAFKLAVLAENSTPALYSDPLYRTPGNMTFARLIARKAREKVRRSLASRLYRNEWRLLYQFGSGLSTTLYRFKPVIDANGYHRADPMIVRHEGRYHVFFEYFRDGVDGQISVITIDRESGASAPEAVLTADHHLSYPFIFQHEGTYYMVPESTASGKISLYRCAEFPLRWEWHKDLMRDVIASDTTLHYHDNKWWLFTCIAQRDSVSTSDELFLFSAEDFRSDNWTPHPMNPVISDVRTARPAGRILEFGGKFYRPSQISAPYYGYGLNLNEIIAFTENDYREKTVSSAKPNWRKEVVGLHTLAWADELTVIDAQYRIPRWRWMRWLGIS